MTEKYDDIEFYSRLIDDDADPATQDRRERCVGTHMGLYTRWGLTRGGDGPLITDEATRNAASAVRAGQMTGTAFLAEFFDFKLLDGIFSPQIAAFTAAYYGGFMSRYMSDTKLTFAVENKNRTEADYDFDAFAALVDARFADFEAGGPKAVQTAGLFTRLFGGSAARNIVWEGK